MALFSHDLIPALESYNVHILVFLLAFLAAITVAHPQFLVTDEWITANQLTQLNEGHQVILNEGKYGSFANGTPTPYFSAKQNYLAYPLFLPLLSLPAEWLVYCLGDNFLFFIVYLWTFLLIALALTLNAFFPAYTHVGKWRWTTGLIIVAFAGFFLNLYYYNSFPLNGPHSFPEILAIVLTNIILFAFLAAMLYEICLTIFDNGLYAFFGTLVCLSCSSWLFWTDFCKDHALIAFLVTAIILMMVKFLHTDRTPFLYGAFLIAGLLAWARPEIALLLAIILCIIVLYITVFQRDRSQNKRARLRIFLSPLFTFVGAIPFFINNYLFTQNIFIPAFIRWNTEAPSSPVTGAETLPLQQNTPDTLGSLLHLIQMGTNIRPSTFFSDVSGVFFSPHNGSMGIVPLVPLFLAVVFLTPFLILREKILFTGREKRLIAGLLLVSMGILFAYIRGISGMNSSLGIVPDMRYLSPIYLPLTLVGLMVIKKIPEITEKPLPLIIGMFSAWAALIPVSFIAILQLYPRSGGWKDIYPLLDLVFTILCYLLILLFLISVFFYIGYKKNAVSAKIFLVLMCALPLIWQVDASLLARLFGSGWGGYSFWIPVVLKGFGLMF